MSIKYEMKLALTCIWLGYVLHGLGDAIMAGNT